MFAQSGDIAQAQVHALPGERMHHVRRIAQQQHAPGEMRRRQLPLQRERRTRGLQAEATELATERIEARHLLRKSVAIGITGVGTYVLLSN